MPLQNAIVQRSAQDVHWRLGLDLRVLFSFPPPKPLAIGNRCSLIYCIALAGLPIRGTGRRPVAAPVMICRVQYFTSSWHYYDGCTAGGLLRKSTVEQCERSATSLQCCTRIALPVSWCSKEMRPLTTCRWAWWCRWGFPPDTFSSLLLIATRGCLYREVWSQGKHYIGAACQLQVPKNVFRGDVFYATVSPNCAHRSFQRCIWICPDSVHKICPLRYGSQNTVIHSTVNDSVMLLIILLHFKWNSHTIQGF
jgi:hypothetical protein